MITQETYQQDRAKWRQRWYAKGFFGSEAVPTVLEESIKKHPDTKFHYYRATGTSDQAKCHQTTARKLFDESSHLARGLWANGIRTGDVVAIQMPTWHETVLLYLAAFQVGAIILPIVHIYGPREVEFILRQAGARTLVIPRRWRKIDFVENFRRMGSLPDLQRVIVVGDDVPDDMLDWRQIKANDAPAFPAPELDPDEPCALIYTSGTTSSPKGVLYSHNNLQAEWRGPFFLTEGPYLCNFPAGHIAGFNFSLRPLVTGTPVVYFDQWDAELVATLIDRHRITESGGTGFFLRELTHFREAKNLDFSSLQLFTMGGTGVTPAEVRLADHHGFKAGRCYGSTEHSTVTYTSPDFLFEKRACTDGRPLRGNQIRIVDSSGNDVAPGAQGEIVTQGPELFIGYTDPDLNLESFLPGGWFCTGDIGRIDEEGFLIITDRKKDVIIRGGENIAPKEVEDILNDMPEIEEAAVTAMPDEHYGEKVCAFVRLKPATILDLNKVRQFFSTAGVARQKTPERLVLVNNFPRTPAGKVKKFELRKQLQDEFDENQKAALEMKAGVPSQEGL